MVKLSETEKDLLEALKGVATVKTLAGNSQLPFARKYPNMTSNSLYQCLNNIRKKFKEAQSFIGLIHAYRGQSPLLKKLLTIRVPQKENGLEALDEMD